MRILPLILFFGASAHATPIFMAGANHDPTHKERVAVEAAPGQRIHLDAGFFDSADGQPPRAVDDPEGTYDWQIRCGDDGSSAPCAGAKLDVSDRGRDLELSGNAPANLRVFVSHLSADGTVDGKFEFDFVPAGADGSPASTERGRLVTHGDDPTPDDPPEPSYHDSGSHSRYEGGSGSPGNGRYRPADTYANASSGFGGSRRSSRGGGGGGGDDDDYSSYRSYRSRRSRRSRDDSYDGYYSRGGGYGYGGGSGDSPTTKRGYNRDNEVPVVSCKNVTGKDGKNTVICEDQIHKVLRLKKAKPTLKPKKPALAKKPLPKNAKKPALAKKPLPKNAKKPASLR